MLTSTLLTAALAGIVSAQGSSNGTSSSNSSSSSSVYGASLSACPSGNSSVSLRMSGLASAGNQTLSSEETAYIKNRRANTLLSSLNTWFGSNASQIYNGSLSDAAQLPTIALAVSGGGDRAALFGAGFLSALDGRNSSSVQLGTGGLLQASTYISALSGGSWMLSSFIFNNFPQSYDTVLGGNGAQGWYLSRDLNSPGGTNATLNNQYYADIFYDVATKKASGPFNVTFGDFWARALSYHFLTGTTNDTFFTNTSDGNHAASLTYSSATSLPAWQNYSIPFPFIIGNVQSPNPGATTTFAYEATVPLQNVVYEISPYEFGSYDPELASFWPTKYLGTRAQSGSPMNGQCATGFDNAGFIMGISSNLFVAYNITKNPVWTNQLSPIYQAWSTINSTFYSQQPEQSMDISAVPNPFEGVNQGVFEDANQSELRMLDGGLNGEVDPIAPFSHPARQIDLIVVADAGADTDENKPSGNSIVATSKRAALLGNNTVSLPPLPMTNQTFLTNGMTTVPTFFGCNGTAANLSGPTQSPYPMMVVLFNYDYGNITNTSTSQLLYPDAEATAFLDTAVGIVTRGRQNSSTEFATCLKCASVERLRGRTGANRTETCNQCFNAYCWNEVDAAASSSNNGSSSGGGGSGTGSSGGGSGTSGGSGSSGGQNGAASVYASGVMTLVAVAAALILNH